LPSTYSFEAAACSLLSSLGVGTVKDPLFIVTAPEKVASVKVAFPVTDKFLVVVVSLISKSPLIFNF